MQISCPLAKLQMFFASFLQEAEMVPPFLLMYATSAVLSSFNNTRSLVLFLQKALQKKGSLQFKGIYVAFIFYAIPSTVI